MLLSRRGVIARRRAVGPQSAAPTSTIAAGNWSIGGGAASLHAALADDNDSTTITTGETITTTARFGLAALTDPGDGTGHVIRIRALSSDGSGTIQVALFEGASERKAATSIGALSTVATAYAVTLTEAEANAITSYASLELRILGSATALQSITVTRARFDID